ncbi:sulfotransferase [Pedosphaera parvula]|uniref:Aspartyl/asparaginyl beta-hydroxylase n=1 Tax=Pedosphaera parvula (strain Ellin514) TaxID=320771 RepID=B9XBL0_PEDPL|nr:sulfotransferase [Pedosphaera parvula]EEF62895.1 aspartyl/asparaginyl beta-hydroxylase [Pedosphaera parvula Ellin514]
MTASHLAGWTPIWIVPHPTGPQVDWCHLNGLRFTHPFFNDTIEHAVRHPFNLLFRQRTSIDLLGEMHATCPGLHPTGFIFHMSRCGSTLVSQMLAALPQNLVLSEAGPIDAILRAHLWNPKFDENQRILWLQWMVSALGQPQQARQKNFFIKFDSWNALDLPLIHKAFPDVPWIFVYREPVEVIVSNLKQLAGKMLPGAVPPSLLDCDLVTALLMSREEYCARALAKYCQNALTHHQQYPGLFINYTQLPDVVFSSITDHFKMHWSTSETEQMRKVTQFNVKDPSRQFVADTAAKTQAASDLVRRLADQWVRPLYDRLETVRQKQSSI